MRQARRGLLMVVATLIAAGVVMVYSSSAIYAQEIYSDSMFFLKRHLFFLVIGVCFSAWILTLDPRLIRKSAKPFMVIMLVALVLVLIPGIGHRVSGASRWFRIAGMGIQPSEFAQLAIILYLADILSRRRGQVEDFVYGVLPGLLVLGLTVGLMLLEPDLGTSVTTAAVSLGLLVMAQVRWKVLTPLFLSAIPAIVILIAIKPYRVRRIIGFMNPWADPEGAGFQLIQSLVALGSGGFLGLGLGESKQKLFYLPAAHTDFIFSVVGEELGFLGATLILALIALFVWFGLKLARGSDDAFGFFAAFGIVMLLALEALVHIAVCTGAMPTKGLPFPFLSYGGSSLIVNMISVAVLLNVVRPHEAGA